MSEEPASRLAMINQMKVNGLLSERAEESLLAWDRKPVSSEAEREWVELLVDRYLDAEPETWKPEQYESPDLLADKKAALLTFSNALFRARLDQLTMPPKEQEKAEFNIQILTRFIQELNEFLSLPPPKPPSLGMRIIFRLRRFCWRVRDAFQVLTETGKD